jgi:hypothetical protein
MKDKPLKRMLIGDDKCDELTRMSVKLQYETGIISERVKVLTARIDGYIADADKTIRETKELMARINADMAARIKLELKGNK